MKFNTKSKYFDETSYHIITDKHCVVFNELDLSQKLFLYFINEGITSEKDLVSHFSTIFNYDFSKYEMLSDLFGFDFEEDIYLSEFLWDSFYIDIYEYTFNTEYEYPVKSMEIIYQEKGTNKYQTVVLDYDSSLYNELFEQLVNNIANLTGEDLTLSLMNLFL